MYRKRVKQTQKESIIRLISIAWTDLILDCLRLGDWHLVLQRNVGYRSKNLVKTGQKSLEWQYCIINFLHFFCGYS